MEKTLEDKLHFLKLSNLISNWDEILNEAKNTNPSYPDFLKSIIDKEYVIKKDHARISRIRRAKIEEQLVIETYPFQKQPKLSKKKIMELFDSGHYIEKKQNIVFVGSTGVGKTGIATALLIYAINKGYSGRFITFPDLLGELYASVADHSEENTLRRFIRYEIMVIDELGYVDIDPHQAGLFFTLMKKRHKNATTIITTQLGFKEWAAFLKNDQLTHALIDRLTENCQVINMKDCTSIRQTVTTDSK